jgi:hypothetical protein
VCVAGKGGGTVAAQRSQVGRRACGCWVRGGGNDDFDFMDDDDDAYVVSDYLGGDTVCLGEHVTGCGGWGVGDGLHPTAKQSARRVRVVTTNYYHTHPLGLGRVGDDDFDLMDDDGDDAYGVSGCVGYKNRQGMAPALPCVGTLQHARRQWGYGRFRESMGDRCSISLIPWQPLCDCFAKTLQAPKPKKPAAPRAPRAPKPAAAPAAAKPAPAPAAAAVAAAATAAQPQYKVPTAAPHKPGSSKAAAAAAKAAAVPAAVAAEAKPAESEPMSLAGRCGRGWLCVGACGVVVLPVAAQGRMSLGSGKHLCCWCAVMPQQPICVFLVLCVLLVLCRAVPLISLFRQTV